MGCRRHPNGELTGPLAGRVTGGGRRGRTRGRDLSSGAEPTIAKSAPVDVLAPSALSTDAGRRMAGSASRVGAATKGAARAAPITATRAARRSRLGIAREGGGADTSGVMTRRLARSAPTEAHASGCRPPVLSAFPVGLALQAPERPLRPGGSLLVGSDPVAAQRFRRGTRLRGERHRFTGTSSSRPLGGPPGRSVRQGSVGRGDRSRSGSERSPSPGRSANDTGLQGAPRKRPPIAREGALTRFSVITWTRRRRMRAGRRSPSRLSDGERRGRV